MAVTEKTNSGICFVMLPDGLELLVVIGVKTLAILLPVDAMEAEIVLENVELITAMVSENFGKDFSEILFYKVVTP